MVRRKLNTTTSCLLVDCTAVRKSSGRRCYNHKSQYICNLILHCITYNHCILHIPILTPWITYCQSWAVVDCCTSIQCQHSWPFSGTLSPLLPSSVGLTLLPTQDSKVGIAWGKSVHRKRWRVNEYRGRGGGRMSAERRGEGYRVKGWWHIYVLPTVQYSDVPRAQGNQDIHYAVDRKHLLQSSCTFGCNWQWHQSWMWLDNVSLREHTKTHSRLSTISCSHKTLSQRLTSC